MDVQQFDNPKLKQKHHMKVDGELRADVNLWINFLQDDTMLCRPFVDFSETLHADELDFFFTDAAKSVKLGFGYYFIRRWTHEVLGQFC